MLATAADFVIYMFTSTSKFQTNPNQSWIEV